VCGLGLLVTSVNVLYVLIEL